MKSLFPEGIRTPSVGRRQKFYSEEFDKRSLERLKTFWDRPVLALDVGSDSTRYRPRFKKYKGKLLFLKSYEDLDHLMEKVVRYAPEDLYYDTRVYEGDIMQPNSVWEKPSGKQLVFHVDPTTLVECDECEKTRRRNRGKRMVEYTFCEECFGEAAQRTRELKSFLERNFDRIKMYFGGRGFYVHVNDEDAFDMADFERETLVSKLSERFPVDKKETTGFVTRLPGSLNGITGRRMVEVSYSELRTPLKILYEKSALKNEKEEDESTLL